MLKRETVWVPQNNTEADQSLEKIAKEQNRINDIQTKLNQDVARLVRVATEEAVGHAARIRELLEGLYIFAEGRRPELVKIGSKTISLASGFLGWRLTPPKVSLQNEESVLKILKARGLTGFIRIKESVDKEAIHKNPEAVSGIKGIKITQKEEFFARPANIDIDITQDESGRKITLPKASSK